MLLLSLFWGPLTGPTVATAARAGEAVLARFASPPLVTGLEASGHSIRIRGILFGPGQFLGRWDAASLPVFVVAGLGLAFALPARGWAGRLALVGGTLAASLAVLGAVATVEALTVADAAVTARDGVQLLSPAGRDRLAFALGWLDPLQMLLPASVAAVAYASARGAEAPAWRSVAVAWGSLTLLVAFVSWPVAPPTVSEVLSRLEQTAQRNPGSASSWMALAGARLRGGQASSAVDAYQQALAAGADESATRLGLARSLLAAGRPAEALAVARAGLRGTPDDPGLVLLTARALQRLDRACEAVEWLARALDSRRGAGGGGGLRRARAAAERQCRRAGVAAGS